MKNPFLLFKINNLFYIFVLFMVYGFMLICILDIYNTFIIIPYNRIILYGKGMLVEATNMFGLWRKKRFYPYGSFGFYAATTGYIFTICRVKIFKINKEYSVFQKDSHVYDFAKNDEIQDMDKMILLLRNKGAEALESQGKANIYNIKEKIRYEVRSVNEHL